MKKYKFIIFDFDGTLADSHMGIVRTFQETFRRLGLPVPTEEVITSTIGLEFKDAFPKMTDKLQGEAIDNAMKLYRSIFPEIAYPVITAFPGVVETLAHLRARGYGMAIATSRAYGSLVDLATQIGVISFFDVMYGAEHVVNHKPAPDLVNLVLDKFKLRPSEVLVVGDATYDMQMGRAAGCDVCAVAWGNHSKEMLAGVNPNYLMDTIPELETIL